MKIRKGLDMQFIGITGRVVQHLRDEIITGELSAGQKLNEAQLPSPLGISRPPLRETLRTLENDATLSRLSIADCHEFCSV